MAWSYRRNCSRLLWRIAKPCEAEGLLLVFREHLLLDVGAKHLENVSELPHSMTAIRERSVPPLESGLGSVDP